MHFILTCCGYYCSCLSIVGIVFFGILMVMVDQHNMYLVRHQSQEEIEEKQDALIIAIVCNAICFVLCGACVGYARFQASKEKDEFEDEDLQLNPLSTG